MHPAPTARFGDMPIEIRVEPYAKDVRGYMAQSGHYLDNPPPGAFFAVVVRRMGAGLFGAAPLEPVGAGLFGRPVCRKLPQGGAVVENTRLVLDDGLPYGTASAVLRAGWAEAARRGAVTGIAKHDRTLHSGTIYRKAGMRKDGKVSSPAGGWNSRGGRKSGKLEPTSKQRWRIDLGALACEAALDDCKEGE